MATATAMATAMAIATATATATTMATAMATAKAQQLQLKLWLLLQDCQLNSPFVYLPSASISCCAITHCLLMPPTGVVPLSSLPRVLVLILPPCHHRPYVRCILFCCRHCACVFLLLPMPHVAALSFILWCILLTSAGNYTSLSSGAFDSHCLHLIDVSPLLPMQRSTLGSCTTTQDGTHSSVRVSGVVCCGHGGMGDFPGTFHLPNS